MENQEKEKTEVNDKKDVPEINILSFAFELGYSIVVPLVVFALLGRWGDRSFGTEPWLMIGGIIISIFISVYIIYKKVVEIFKKF